MSREVTLFEVGMVNLVGSGNYGEGNYGAGDYGSGGGNTFLRLGPGYAGVQWSPGTIIVSTPSQNIPQFFLYKDIISQETLLGSTINGNSDQVAYGGPPLYTGHTLIGMWIGGDAGVQATMTITGTKRIPG